MTVAPLIAQNLGDLVHPGDEKRKPTPIPLPIFRESAITDEQREYFNQEAGVPGNDLPLLVAEAIEALILKDHVILTRTEAHQLQSAAKAAEPQRHQQIHLHCRQCRELLFQAEVTDFDTGHPAVRPQVIKAMQMLNPECATGHHAQA